ncbi:histidine--tRNA ligase [Buchnera aphidicola (Kurisakia onigurumii)]|uniref:histidine--tRNA ligase n=1 Tax=Buchnera aphidicola TaxID=9 RepID=UPI0031B69195
MNKFFRSIRGVHDYVPNEVIILKKIEKILIKVIEQHCFQEIRIPILEFSSLFTSTIGQGTDIVEKEMYSFIDKSKNFLTLRPEGTVGCVRSVIQNKLIKKYLDTRLWYLGPMFRYERPQKGRYRQFYQLGLEVFGLSREDIELELLMITYKWWKKLGIIDFVQLEINSIGSVKNRIQYQKKLVNFLKKYEKYLDPDSKKKLDLNPLGLLDSKNYFIKKVLIRAPKIIDFLDSKYILQFKKLCRLLKIFNIPFIINKNLVRGLSYYNGIVFEWKNNTLDTQNTICAGGRYDYLSKKLNNCDIPSIGLAVGMDRLLLTVKLLNKSKLLNNFTLIDVKIVFLEEIFKLEAIKLSNNIRIMFPNIKLKVDFFSSNLSKKIKMALSSQVHIMIIIGRREFEKKCVMVKNLITVSQKIIPIKKINIFLKNVLDFK